MRQLSLTIADMIQNRKEYSEKVSTAEPVDFMSDNFAEQLDSAKAVERLTESFQELQRELEESLRALISHTVIAMRDSGEIH